MVKTLDNVLPGSRVIIRKLRGGKCFESRMAALGFTVDAEVKVIRNFRRGPLIAIVRDTRVALGRGEARKVLVEEISSDQ